MKHPTPATHGKIISHDHGTGQLAPADIEARARENALINGHASPTSADRVQANHELRGDHLPPTIDEDSTSSRALTRDPSEPASHFGSETPNQESDDAQNNAERMVIEGVEEAQHDQMIAARRRRS
jgi:hypothetical protein